MRLLLGAALVLTPPAALAQAPSAPGSPGGAPAQASSATGTPAEAAPTPPRASSTSAAPSAEAESAATSPAVATAPAQGEVPSAKVDATSAPGVKDEPSLGADSKWDDPTLEAAPGAGEEQESLGWTLLRTLLVLGAVVASIYLTLNVGLRRLMGLQAVASGRQPLVSVVERLPLDQRRSLFVVKAADEYLLVGGGEAGLQLLSKLDSAAVERIRAQRPETNVVPLSPFLQKLLSRRSGGSPSQPPGA
ncbi:flagellar biosynthetic protein FliO [Myxococcus sp. RHST-1-4]|nr:flagellar biosynthetic protein FliO [Myxococcus sp. RHSTA-1-4]